MHPEDQSHSAQPQKRAANKGLAADFSDEALKNLAGFFDVLIQMDLEQKSNERKGDEDSQAVHEHRPEDS